MAIKGKKRSRGGRSRAPAAPPKPKLVTPKKPPFQRTWVRVTFVLIVLGGIAGGAWAIWVDRRNAAEREERQEAVSRAGLRIETALSQVGQVIPGAGVLVLPEMSQAILEIQSGEFRPRRIRRGAEDWLERLAGADAALAAIETDNRDLRRAIRTLREGLAGYTAVAADVPGALDLDEEEREAFLTELQERLAEPAGIVNSGWLIYQNERVDVGLEGPEAPQPGVQTVIPPGFDPFQQPGPDEGGTPQEAPAG